MLQYALGDESTGAVGRGNRDDLRRGAKEVGDGPFQVVGRDPIFGSNVENFFIEIMSREMAEATGQILKRRLSNLGDVAAVVGFDRSDQSFESRVVKTKIFVCFSPFFDERLTCDVYFLLPRLDGTRLALLVKVAEYLLATLRCILDAEQDAVPVSGAQGQGLEDEHVQGAGEQFASAEHGLLSVYLGESLLG